MCKACAVVYDMPTEARFGARVGEVLNLCRRATKPRRRRGANKNGKGPIVMTPTGATVQVVEGDEFEVAGRMFHFVRYVLEGVACPACGEAALVMGFEPGDACPKCKSGSLKVSFVE